MNFKAAIFDMDGTLVDSLGVWNVVWSAFGERYKDNKNFMPSPEDDKAVRTLLLKDAMELIHENYGMGESGKELLDFANEIIEEFYENRVELKPGACEFLEHLKNSGTKMCIASATERRLIMLAMKHCDIEKYFLKVFSCGDIGKGKDQPDIFLEACTFLGETPENTWVFEDSLTAIETAVSIKMPTVGIFDPNNFGQERIKELATEYVADGETLLKIF